MKLIIDKDGQILNEDKNPVERIRYLDIDETIEIIDERKKSLGIEMVVDKTLEKGTAKLGNIKIINLNAGKK